MRAHLEAARGFPADVPKVPGKQLLGARAFDAGGQHQAGAGSYVYVYLGAQVRPQVQTACAVLAPWFLRGDLPERLALMVNRPECPRGTVFDWIQERRGYKARGLDLWVIPQVIREGWLVDWCWAPPEQAELFLA